MDTENVVVDSLAPAAEAIQRAAKLIKCGEVVAFPTETVYGLGANGLDADACRKIYAAKGRPADNPLILHALDAEMLRTLVRELSAEELQLIERFTPGPLTLILPKSKRVPDIVTGGLVTVAVRIPAHPVARALIAASGVPIAAPSANISGRPSPTNAAMVVKDLAGKIPLILDGGDAACGLESTIVKISKNDNNITMSILREGAVTREQLRDGLPQAMIVGVDIPVEANSAPTAPGMKYRHYAPRAPLFVIEAGADREELLARFRAELIHRDSRGERVGIIASTELLASLNNISLDSELIFDYGSYQNLAAIAANLYKALSFFDDKDVEAILIEGVLTVGMGAAIMNRLRKASIIS